MKQSVKSAANLQIIIAMIKIWNWICNWCKLRIDLTLLSQNNIYMKKLLIILLIALMPLLYGCREVVVRYSENGSIVHMTIDQILKIELPGDATSGNDWRKVAYADSLIIRSGKPNYMLGDGGGGSPGVYYFRFKAVAAGTSQLYLEYGSKYDSDEKAIDRFEVTVVIHEKKK